MSDLFTIDIGDDKKERRPKTVRKVKKRVEEERLPTWEELAETWRTRLRKAQKVSREARKVGIKGESVVATTIKDIIPIRYFYQCHNIRKFGLMCLSFI